MINRILKIGSLLLLSSCFSSSMILNEEFSTNKLGWVEEQTESHAVNISEGFYLIESFDSTATQSSTGPENKSFLWNLPENYKITSSIYPLTQKLEKASFGIILWSATLEYRFEVHTNGIIVAQEYNFSTKKSKILAQDWNKNLGETVELDILIRKNNFEFMVNDKSIGTGKLRAKSWSDLRLFTTTMSSIKVNYLRVEALKN